MSRASTYGGGVVAAGAAVMLAVTIASAGAQKASPADVAVKLSGTWTINRELSPAFRPSGPGGGRRGGAAFAVGGLGVQRGNRGGGGGGDTGPNTPADMTPEELAAQAAMGQIQQLAQVVTIKATADSITFADTRGEQTYAIDGKTAKLEVGGAKIEVKSKWDKTLLRQEFSSTRSKLNRSWEVDDSGRLVVKARIENMTRYMPEIKAVYDRQP